MATSYTPPENATWWNEPIERTEVVWITVAFRWCLFMLFWMIAWHWIGNQNMANEVYKVTPEAYSKKVEDFTAQYTVHQDVNDPTFPVVHPPTGGDVYLPASRWQWRPLIELEKGKCYRVHISSLDRSTHSLYHAMIYRTALLTRSKPCPIASKS